MVELVDTTDLKSVGPHAVPVRVRVAAPLTALSSAGQSNGLLSRGSQVRILEGRPMQEKIPNGINQLPVNNRYRRGSFFLCSLG